MECPKDIKQPQHPFNTQRASPQREDVLAEPCPFVPAVLDSFIGAIDHSPVVDVDTRYPEDFSAPVPCSFLRVGQTFTGQQRAAHTSSSQEQWGVTVRIQVTCTGG